VFAAQNSSVSNGASGTATVNLRGLGSTRTLVLVNGRRLPFGSPLDPAADLNQIPSPLVERVEVLTGGAASIYGSDAVAGVVNFIMQQNFEGIRLEAQYSFYQHNNDYGTNGNLREVIAGRAATNPTQFRLPDDNVDDGYGKQLSAMMGLNSADGKGNITIYATYRNNDEVLQGNRDYSACSIGVANATGFTCGGSGTASPGRLLSLAGGTFTGADLVANSNNSFRAYSGATDQYNFGPLNFYQRPDERYSLGAFGRYQLTEQIEAYAELMFTDYQSTAQIAPGGVFFGGGTTQSGGYLIGCDNPFFTGTQAAQLAAGGPA
jgi:outer membrane receptor protein involved in Fe transport